MTGQYQVRISTLTTDLETASRSSTKYRLRSKKRDQAALSTCGPHAGDFAMKGRFGTGLLGALGIRPSQRPRRAIRQVRRILRSRK